jgi:hypothetical protein
LLNQFAIALFHISLDRGVPEQFSQISTGDHKVQNVVTVPRFHRFEINLERFGRNRCEPPTSRRGRIC